MARSIQKTQKSLYQAKDRLFSVSTANARHGDDRNLTSLLWASITPQQSLSPCCVNRYSPYILSATVEKKSLLRQLT
jgi:hypothetical protein